MKYRIVKYAGDETKLAVEVLENGEWKYLPLVRPIEPKGFYHGDKTFEDVESARAAVERRKQVDERKMKSEASEVVEEC